MGNYCMECPYGSTGIFPNCSCSDGGSFNGNFCDDCPWNSHGKYGECICDGNATYIKEDNICYECPEDRFALKVY